MFLLYILHCIQWGKKYLESLFKLKYEYKSVKMPQVKVLLSNFSLKVQFVAFNLLDLLAEIEYK